MATATRKRPVSDLRVSVLSELVGPPLERLVDEAVQDLRLGRRRAPVEILPSGELISGREDVIAADRLRIKELEAQIRDDLAQAGEQAIQRAALEAEMAKRPLDVPAIVRMVCLLHALDTSRALPDFRPRDWHDCRAEVATWFRGRCQRTIKRYMNTMHAPRVVQDACSNDLLDLAEVLQVAHLPAQVRELIATEIAAGGVPSEVVARHARRPASCVGLRAEYRRLLRDGPDIVRRLAANPSALAGQAAPREALEALREMRRGLQTLLRAEARAMNQVTNESEADILSASK